MASKEKPYILLVAELIYLKICEIKKTNPEFSNINSIEAFIGTETYQEISSGKFHDKLLEKLKNDNFIDKKTKKKIPEETIRLLHIQKAIFHWKYLSVHLIIYGEYVKVTSCGVKKLNRLNY